MRTCVALCAGAWCVVRALGVVRPWCVVCAWCVVRAWCARGAWVRACAAWARACAGVGGWRIQQTHKKALNANFHGLKKCPNSKILDPDSLDPST